MPEKIPRSDIIKDIQRVAAELGKVPSRAEYTEHGEYSRTPAENEFGSWTAAREAAGLEGGPQKSTHIPKGEIIEDIQRVADELGKVPSREEYGEHGEYHKTTPERKFGSWTAAREAAGLEGGPSKNTHIPKGDVIEDIQRVAKELGKTPSRREYRECGEYTAWTARQRFGSWARAREAAGLNGAPTKNTFVTKGDIIEDLRRVAHEIGESPSQPQYNKYGQYTHQVAYSRFGGWNAALIEAGLETEKDTRLPDEKFLRDIRSVGEKRGYAPSQAYYRKHGEHGVTTIKRRFDSWDEAVRKAGLEPNGPGANPGERNGYWKGGYEPYYGRNWHEQRRKARARDGYECVACGMKDGQHVEKFGWELEVHHIIPVREFDRPEDANGLENLITLCRPHHRKYEHLPAARARELNSDVQQSLTDNIKNEG